jgi:hypothetical protein
MRSFFVKTIVLLFLLTLGLSTSRALARTVVLDFQATGCGKITNPGAEGCQSDDHGCTVQSEGTVSSRHFGRAKFSSTLTILWKSATPNGEGTSSSPTGFCAPASGTTEITITGAILNLEQVGIVCEVGPTGTDVPHTFNGTFFITGGTNKYAGETGTGNLTVSDDGRGNVLLNLRGTIKR